MGVVVAREKFFAEIDGVTFDVFAGDHFETAHPLVKKHPHLFDEPEFKFPVKDAPKAAEPRKATAAEEKAIAATVEAEAKSEAKTGGLKTSDLRK
jgi:hypothetical protein